MHGLPSCPSCAHYSGRPRLCGHMMCSRRVDFVPKSGVYLLFSGEMGCRLVYRSLYNFAAAGHSSCALYATWTSLHVQYPNIRCSGQGCSSVTDGPTERDLPSSIPTNFMVHVSDWFDCRLGHPTSGSNPRPRRSRVTAGTLRGKSLLVNVSFLLTSKFSISFL